MSYYAYVIYSTSSGRYYKGHCKDIDVRLKEHNAGRTISIRPYIPWEVVYYEEFQTLEEAIIRERYFKSAAGRRYLKKKI